MSKKGSNPPPPDRMHRPPPPPTPPPWRKIMTTPKGEKLPQTVENLQAVMAADAVLMQRQGERIRTLLVRVDKLERKLKGRRK